MQMLLSKRYSSLALYLLIAAIAALPFSYHPLLTLGSVQGVHIDISLLYILVVSAVIVNLPYIWHKRDLLSKNIPAVLLASFGLFVAIAGLWSQNGFRAIVTSGFMLLLTLFVYSIYLRWNELKRQRLLVTRLLITTYSVAAAWSLWQLFGDAWGASNALTLLPEAYRSSVFGVARPTGLALEPQFLASLLIIPAIWLGYSLMAKKYQKITAVGFIAAAVLLILTLSRGGLLALGVGIILLGLLYRPPISYWLRIAGFSATAIVIALGTIYLAASSNTRTPISGYAAVSRTINHLSLGVIDLPQPTITPAPSSNKSPKKHPNSNQVEQSKGYVASSTDSRTGMAYQAMQLWSSTPSTVLFGIGTGGFGASLHSQQAHHSLSSIVNNNYLEILAETGLVGLGLFLSLLSSLIYLLYKRRAYSLIAVLGALLVQWCFFSGNANVIHIWVVIAVAIGISTITPKKAARSGTIS